MSKKTKRLKHKRHGHSDTSSQPAPVHRVPVEQSRLDVDFETLQEDGWLTRAIGSLIDYLRGWWERKGAIVQALVDDVLLSVCLLATMGIVQWLLSFAGQYIQGLESHHEFHRRGFEACDIAIVTSLVRKFVVLLWFHR